MRIRRIPTGRQRRRRRLRTLTKAILFAAVAGALGAAGLYIYFSMHLPKLKTLADYRPAVPTLMYDQDGHEAARFFTENREVISIDQVPRMVIDAIISIEDSHYYEHTGLDYLGILRAFIANLRAGEIKQGGSTITQQVAKRLLLSNERRYSRKAKEAILARRITKSFTKDEILEIYLNEVYLGHGAYGIEAASELYFSRHVWELDLPQAAMLAGLPKAPSSYDPTRNPEAAIERRNLVLTRMMEENYIDQAQRDEAAEQPLNLQPKEADPEDPNAYFAEEVRRYLYEKYGEDALYRGGMKVYTTLNAEMQQQAMRSVKEGLQELDRRQGYRGPVELVTEDNVAGMKERLIQENGLEGYQSGVTPELPWQEGQVLLGLVFKVEKEGAYLELGGVPGFIPIKQMRWARKPNPKLRSDEDVMDDARDILSERDLIRARYLGRKNDQGVPLLTLEQDPLAESALVCMDAPTGKVYALVGGYDFNRSEFNRATQAYRQPGSAFKPIVYSTAMDNGFTPSSIIIDSPIIYDDPTEELKWKPSNYSEKWYGPTTLRTGLVKSRNVITIKLVQKLGIQAIIQYARRFGVTQDLPEDLSISLGSMGLTPLQLTSAYTVFPNLGLRASPWLVTKVVDRDGNVLEQGGPELVRSLSEDTAFIMQNLLRGVVQSGTGWRARALGRPSGGKTGTTNDMVDAWYMGFTPDIVTGVWVGFDEEASLGAIETGSRAAAPIWVKFMTAAMENRPLLPFPPPPPGIEMVKVEPKSGLLAGPGVDKFIYEAFKIGTAPKEFARSSQPTGRGTGGRTYTPGYRPRTRQLPGVLPRDF